MKSLAKKWASILILTAGLLLLGAGVASAHVTVSAPGVTEGQSDAAITFRVPDESATASTVGLKVQLPTDHPIAGVLVAPVPGWTAKIITTKLTTPITTDDGMITQVVSEIDWTAAAGAGIEPGFFGEFTVIAGQLPDVPTLTFKAVQTYSDQTVVSWIEEAAPGSTPEPEHPAPELTLLPAASSAAASSPAPASSTGASSAAATPSTTGVSVTAAAAATNAASKGSVTTATVIAVVGVVIGVAGVALALASRRRPAAK